MTCSRYSLSPHINWESFQFSSVAQSCPDSSWPHGPQHARLPCPSPTPRVYSNSYPLSQSQWCHPTISSPVIPFSSHLQSFLASRFFLMSQFLTSGGQSIGVSASASVLAMNIQDWSPLGWTSWISLQSKALSRAFSNTTVHWVTKSWDNWSDLTQYTTFVKFLKLTARFAWDLSLGKIRISVW